MGLTEAGKAISQLQGTWVQTIQLREGNGLPSGEGLPPNPPIRRRLRELSRAQGRGTGERRCAMQRVSHGDARIPEGWGSAVGVLRPLPQIEASF